MGERLLSRGLLWRSNRQAPTAWHLPAPSPPHLANFPTAPRPRRTIAIRSCAGAPRAMETTSMNTSMASAFWVAKRKSNRNCRGPRSTTWASVSFQEVFFGVQIDKRRQHGTCQRRPRHIWLTFPQLQSQSDPVPEHPVPWRQLQ